jgi:ATP-dependent DNA helicase RecG
MPTALETLIKILKQERESGCDNKTVIGGLGAYRNNWQRQAKEQAKRAEHIVLADELFNILATYDTTNDKAERLKQIQYMLDRITGRIPVPPHYLEQLEQVRQNMPQQSSPAQNQRPERPPRAEKPDKSDKSDRSTDRTDRKERTTAPRAERPAKPERPPRAEKPERSEKPNPSIENASTPKSEARPPRPEKRQKPERIEQLEKREYVPPTFDDDDDDDDDEPRMNTRQNQKGERPRPDRRDGRSPQRDDRRPSRGDSYDMGREAIAFDLRAIDGGELDIKPFPKLARPPRQARQFLSSDDAEKRLAELKKPVTVIKGIGAKVAQTLEPMGIQTVEDMIYYLPRRYDDYTQLLYISKLRPNSVATVIATVKSAMERAGQHGRKDFAITVEDGTGKLYITFFGMGFLRSKIRPGMQLVLSGKVSIYRQFLQMNNPEWEVVDNENLHTVGIVPVYRMVQDVKPRSFRRTMKQAIDTWANRVPDYVPSSTLERTELADLGWAIKNLHFPEGFDHLHHAQRRRAFDELLLLQLAILGNRREWQGVPGQPLDVTDGFLETFIEQAFPFPLTGAQRRTIEDIRRDVSQAIPMNRLVQGDVGAGKTAVAITAMAMAVANGKQAAIMAPTSILAEQHYRGVSRIFANFPTQEGEHKPVIGLLTSALTNSEREAIYRGLADGSIDVIVGTHALIQAGVDFKDLAVAVIDEQHRFGVEQRARLRGKGYNPHLLVMTATPIPRTLALTMYADLDLSVIDEKPQGRLPIKTKLLLPDERRKCYNFVESQLELGRQAFVVHPLVETSDKIEARSAMDAYEDLRIVFHKYRVCLLHGRMKPAEKDEIMGAFSRHEYDLMVTTSVAEVGVDIPNASVMVIESANRFGLAQLHQFRGRVGRGEHQSFCLLMVEDDIFDEDDLSNPEEKRDSWGTVQKRLKAMEDSDDGFRLAELDWQLRGAGDLLSTRQSGANTLQLAEMMTPDLVAMSQREARTIYEEDPSLELPQHHLLRQMVTMLHQQDGDVS